MTIEEAKKEIIDSGLNLGAGDYVDIEALKVAATVLGAFEQIKWERDVAIEQLNELGLSLGQKVDDVKEVIEKQESKIVAYQNGSYVCPTCGEPTFPLAIYKGDYCLKCGQHIKWREVIKAKK
jgi:hypothetical protein